MSNMDQAPEPTMDEILASIRRIISDEPTNKKGKSGPVDKQVALDIAKALSADDIIEPSMKMETFNDPNAGLDEDILDLAEIATVAPNISLPSNAPQGRELLQNFSPNQTQGIPLPHASEYALKEQAMQRGPHIQNVPHQQSQPFTGMPPVQGRESGLPMPQMAPQIAPQMAYQTMPPQPHMQPQAMQQIAQMQQMQNSGAAQVANYMQNGRDPGFMDPHQEVPSMAVPVQQVSEQGFPFPDASKMNAERVSAEQGFGTGPDMQPGHVVRDFTAEIAQDMRIFQDSAGDPLSVAGFDHGSDAGTGTENEAWIADNAEDGAGEENVFGASSLSDAGQDFGKPKPFIRRAMQDEAGNLKQDRPIDTFTSSQSQEAHKVDLTDNVRFEDDLQEDLAEDFAQASGDALDEASALSEEARFEERKVPGDFTDTDVLPVKGQSEELTLARQDDAVMEGERGEVFESHVKQMKDAVSEVVSEQVEHSFAEEISHSVSHSVSGQIQKDQTGQSTMPSQSNSAQANPFEQGIKDMLKPMLKQWLDENMPRLVEGAMKDQISRKD